MGEKERASMEESERRESGIGEESISGERWLGGGEREEREHGERRN